MSARARSPKEVFAAASEITSRAERAAYLDAACVGDAELRREVEDLLKHHAELDGFLDGAERDDDDEMPHAEPGTCIGPYELLEEIGEGGFGVVYLAEQSAPVRRRVALKVLKAGMDTREVVTRFEAERQALALMDHPGIARVFDGGATPGGRPYFVMELVKGVPLNEYCDSSRLPVEERLELFVRVCRAVQHAHQKGVIHRDLKPSNILVCMQDGQAVPKVIDFGIAKATGQRLTERTFHTRFAQMIGTPQYMSPEQAEMSALDVDTRSDVYSLGVLLYELLVGSTPVTCERMSTATFDELRRMIREEDPPTPSARLTSLNGDGAKVARCRRSDPRRLARRIHGDLDWIVMRALEKDRSRRYESASALAGDVRNHLADEPVEARPPARLYRARKYLRRNRVGVGFGLVAVALLAFGAWVLHQRDLRADRLVATAETSLQDAARLRAEGRALADLPERWQEKLDEARSTVEVASTLLSGADVTVPPEVVARVQAMADGIRADEGDRALVVVLERILIDRLHRVGNRARDDIAMDEYRAVYAGLGLTPDASSAADVAAALLARREPARAWLIQGLDEWLWLALRSEHRDLSWLRAAVAATDDDPWRVRIRKARADQDRKTLETLARADDVLEQPRTTWRLLARALMDLGAVERAVEFRVRAQAERPDDFWTNLALASAYAMHLKRYPDALVYFRVCVALRPAGRAYLGLNYVLQQLRRHDEALVAIQKSIASDGRFAPAYVNLGGTLEMLGRPEEALQAYRRAIEIQPDVPHAHQNLGALLSERKQWDEAIQALLEARRLDPTEGKIHASLGGAWLRTGRSKEALASHRRALELGYEDAVVHTDLSNCYLDKQDAKRALPHARRAVELDEKDAIAHNNLGMALDLAGKRTEARGAYEKAIELRPDLAIAYGNLAALLGDLAVFTGEWQNMRKALEHARKAIELDEKVASHHATLGVLLTQSGNVPGAFEAFEKAVSLDPKDAQIRYNLAHVLAAVGRTSEAKDSYREAIRLLPEHAEANVNLGRILVGEGHVTDGIARYRRALEINARHPEANANLGAALSGIGTHTKAIEHLELALEVMPRFPWARAHLGIAYMRAGRSDEARAQWDTLLAPESAEPAALNELAWTLATSAEPALRDPSRAVKLAEAAARLVPQDWAIANTLGVARFRAGDDEGALQALEASMQAQGGGTAFDWYFVAMARWRLDRKQEARQMLAKAVAWRKATAPEDAELARFHAEAEALIGSAQGADK